MVLRDTSVLKTRDVSFVGAELRRGLHRIHERRGASDTDFRQRFEYVVKGTAAAVQSFTRARVIAGDHLSEMRDVNGTTYALVLTAAPVAVPSTLTGVSFTELRTGARNGSLGWLWQRLNRGVY